MSQSKQIALSAPAAVPRGRAHLAVVRSDGVPPCPPSALVSLEAWAIWRFTTTLGMSQDEAREFLGLAGGGPRPRRLRVVR